MIDQTWLFFRTLRDAGMIVKSSWQDNFVKAMKYLHEDDSFSLHFKIECIHFWDFYHTDRNELLKQYIFLILHITFSNIKQGNYSYKYICICNYNFLVVSKSKTIYTKTSFGFSWTFFHVSIVFKGCSLIRSLICKNVMSSLYPL